MQLRVSRHTERLSEVVDFYRRLGLTETGRFCNHDGYDGVFLAVPGTPAHLELTAGAIMGLRRRIPNRCWGAKSARACGDRDRLRPPR